MTNYIGLSNFLRSNKIPTRQGGTRYEKWEGKKIRAPEKFLKLPPLFQFAPPIGGGAAEPGDTCPQ